MTCPHCDHAVSTMVFLIICAYCKKAWVPYEFESEWVWREQREQQVEDSPNAG